MKKYILSFFALFSFFIVACEENKSDKKTNTIVFGTSAEYPPFEYMENNVLKGFDIDLAKLIAKELGKEAVFQSIQFSTLLPALSLNKIDAAIATITITEDRKKNFDFSIPYYFESLAAIYPKENIIDNKSQLTDKKISYQLGTSMEIWVKNNFPTTDVVSFDNNNQAIEAVKSKKVDVVIVDGIQGFEFSKKNPTLTYSIIEKSSNGYGLAFNKKSPLLAEINQVLKRLEASGELQKLKNLWIENTSAEENKG